jgi:hypothetical protein
MKALFSKRKKADQVQPGFTENNGTHYQRVLCDLEDALNANWYLEIGSRSGTSLADRKCSFVAIDPEFAVNAPVFNSAPQMHFMQQTSDDFFASDFLKNNNIVPDFAFIDGMHLFEYALRDFLNAEAAMAPNGVICLHDVLPTSMEMTTRDVGYLRHKLPWTGDVWKIIPVLAKYRPDLKLWPMNCHKTGLLAVSGLNPNDRTLSTAMDEILQTYQTLELADFGIDSFYSSFEFSTPQDFLNVVRRG